MALEIVEYLKSPPDAAELGRLLDMLGLEPRQLMRRKEAVDRELGLKEALARPRGWGTSARPGAQGAFGRRLPAIWDSGGPASRRAPRLPGRADVPP